MSGGGFGGNKNEVLKRSHDLELTAFLLCAARGVRVSLVRRGLRGHELEDCSQEVFVELIQRWSQLRNYPAPARHVYVGRVCHGAASNWVRRARSTGKLFAPSDAERASDPRQTGSAEREYLGFRVRSAVETCLAGCVPGARTTFVLVCLDGHTEAEAAALQGIPLGTVASRLRRIRARLRRELRAK